MSFVRPLPLISAALLCAPLVSLHSMDKARVETRVDEAVRKFGVSGRNVLVAILDRGIDWKNNDFRNPDGTTRIEGILDLTDSTGATDAKNRFKRGTLYSKQQIDAALAGGTALAHRDAVGHGTTTTGIAAGNGRNSRDWKYRGEAPKARILVIKMVAGAPAHDDQPAEPSYVTDGKEIPVGIDYALEQATALGIPVVMLPNIGSVGGPMDGTSKDAKLIDSTFGPGKPGRVFVTGSSDDGGQDNHSAPGPSIWKSGIRRPTATT
jgi:minor extracellular serine protease Vpr